MTDTTARLSLPMIVPGQAQKEMTHNEALALLAIAVQASVQGVGVDLPPVDPATGACWVVGSTPGGAWTGQAGRIAGWTAGGWRFVSPHPGFTVHVVPTGQTAVYENDTWRIDTPADAIALPTGGDVVDTQARTAIASLIDALHRFRLVAK